MNFNEYNVAPCVIPPSTVGGKCAGIDPRCLDPEWAANHPETCPGAGSITGLVVTPAVGQVDVGGAVPFIASLTFSDGKSKDVTLLAQWGVSDASIASIDVRGLATGLGTGDTTVQASYSGLTAFAELDVVAHCVQAGMDIVIVFDRSAGMGDSETFDHKPTPGGATILDLCKKAAGALVGSAVLTSGKDKIAIVSCAGIFREFPGNPHPYTPSSTLHLRLSSVKDDILAAIDTVQMGNCYFDTTPGNHNSECATGIGAGLDRAKQELVEDGRDNARQLIIYVGLGWEVFCDPSPAAVAADIRGRNFQLAGILTGPPVTHQTCDLGGPMSTWDYVRALVTCNLFFGVADLDDLPNAFSGVLNALCAIQNDPCVYYIPPEADPPPPRRYRDQLDYFGWINWDVVKGYVDLIGIDLWPLQPGHGLFIDMVGTDQTHIEDKDAVGAIQSKKAFTFAPGRYRLSFQVAGNLRFPSNPMSIRVTIGSLLDQTVTVDNWQQPFTEYQFDFSTGSASSGKIKFDHQTPTGDWVRTVGLLLDDVHLENLDTGDVLLDDNFDSENPLP